MMNQTIKVTECYKTCPFFGIDMDGMQCNHPYWKAASLGYKSGTIITHDNSKNGLIPDECPLKLFEKLVITYKLEKNEN